MSLQLIRKHDQAVVVSDGKIADHYWSRLKGLIGNKNFGEGEGLLFPRCNNIHMWMMSIPIDVLFLKASSPQSWEILKVVQSVKPWKVLPVTCLHADDTLELPSGTVSKFKLKPGEVLCTAS